MSKQMTLEDIPNVTFLPESEAGASRLSLQDGTPANQSGQVVARVHRSVPQEKNKDVRSAVAKLLFRILYEQDTSYVQSANTNGLQTKGTCGLNSTDLSKSASLQSYLENRLQANLEEFGSPEYVLRWKTWAMELGVPICALRASARRISDKDFSGEHGYPTPKTPTGGANSKRKERKAGGADLQETVHLTSWGTPRATNNCGIPTEKTGKGSRVEDQALISGWSKTPLAGDAEGGVMEIRPGTTGKYKLRDYALIAGWPTANVSDMKGENMKNNHDLKKGYLRAVCFMAGYPTPSSRDYKDTPGMAVKAINPDGSIRNRADQLPRLVYQVFLHGITSDSCSAATTKYGGYRLNPYFSAWLMGFPKEWTKAGIAAHLTLKAASRSRRKSKVKQCSSKDTETQ